MVYSYTQISQYLRCPRSYRYRYLDGWREEWDAYRDAPFEFRKGESWDRLFHQGVHLLETFARDNRVRIRGPKQNLQIKMPRALPAEANSSPILMPSGRSMVSTA